MLHLIAYHILVCIVFVVEDGYDFSKLCQDVVVSCHVGSQDAPNYSLTYLSAEDKSVNYRIIEASQLLVHHNL